MLKTIKIAPSGGNVTPVVAAAVAQLRPGEPARLEFEKATYHFFMEGCVTAERGISATEGLTKNFVMLLENLSDLTVEGNGAEFIFHDRLFPIAVLHCRNVTIRNFTIDFSFTRYGEGVVTASDETGFSLAVDRANFRLETDGDGHLIFPSGTKRCTTADWQILIGNAVFGRPPWDYIFAGDSTYDRSNLPAKWIDTDAETTAEGVRFTYRPESRKLVFNVGDTLIFSYEPRDNANFTASHCDNVLLENVTMYRGGGMGCIVSDTHDFTARGVVIMPKPGRRECRSTSADGFYFVQCTGTVTVTGCRIQETLDDALNFHGLYTEVAQVIDAHTLRLRFALESCIGITPYRVGDKLTVSGGEKERIRFTLPILSCQEEPGHTFLLKLNGDVSAAQPGDVAQDEELAADFNFTDNEVIRCPNVRMADKGKIRVSGNTFTEFFGLQISDLCRYWRETGAVRDLVIENNRFIHCPREGGSRVINVSSTRHRESDARHCNVTIRNNVFQECRSPVKMRLEMTDGLTVTDNLFDEGDVQTMIEVLDCTGVTLRGNRVDPQMTR